MKKQRPVKLFRDQHGECFFARTLKELRAQVPGRISKMYIDKKDLSTVHIGYVIGQHWLSEYSVVERPA